jgi:hypothetical protein
VVALPLVKAKRYLKYNGHTRYKGGGIFLHLIYFPVAFGVLVGEPTSVRQEK